MADKDATSYRTKSGTTIKQDSQGGKQFKSSKEIPGGRKTTQYDYRPPKK